MFSCCAVSGTKDFFGTPNKCCDFFVGNDFLFSFLPKDLSECGRNPYFDEAKLRMLKSVVESQLAPQTFKVNHLPNFNVDCISFVSSVTRSGFLEFEENLTKAISRLPKVLIQKTWKEASDWLLGANQDKPYVALADFLAWASSDGNLREYDVLELLKVCG